MERVSMDTVKANMARMHHDMAQRLASHARNGAAIMVHMRRGSDGVTTLLIADAVIGERQDRCSFFLKDEDIHLVTNISTCLNGSENSQKLGRKALASLCDRYI
jgi:hypothetical protein